MVCDFYRWLYKSNVFKVFKDLCALIENKFGNTVKVLCSDNGIEYVNQEFEQFLISKGIEHQTTCVNTPEQNGVAEQKIGIYLRLLAPLCFQ